MKFKVDRTSACLWDNEPPCPKAVETENSKLLGLAGNHYNEYEIEINTIEELVQFINDNGTIVFSECGIEIYDDYRE